MSDTNKHYRGASVNAVPLNLEDFTPEELEKLRRRFEFWVDKSPRHGGCHVWRGKPRGNGYGEIQVGAHKPAAHRVAYFLEHLELPDERILHSRRCTSKLCVNPAHLRAGTNGDNVRDAQAAGTWRNNSALDEGDRVEMKELYSTGEYTQLDLAHIFNTTPSTVWKILNGYSKPNGAVVLVDVPVVSDEEDLDSPDFDDSLDFDVIDMPDGDIIPSVYVQEVA